MSNLIIVEGQTEEKFFKTYKDLLNNKSLIKIGRLFQDPTIKNKLFGEIYENVYIILDADMFTGNWDIFKENYKKINADNKDSNYDLYICLFFSAIL